MDLHNEQGFPIRTVRGRPRRAWRGLRGEGIASCPCRLPCWFHDLLDEGQGSGGELVARNYFCHAKFLRAFPAFYVLVVGECEDRNGHGAVVSFQGLDRLESIQGLIVDI